MATTEHAERTRTRGGARQVSAGSPTASEILGRSDLHVVDPHAVDLHVMASATRRRELGMLPGVVPAGTWEAPVPCPAHPCSGLVHVDGPCRCFVGGPAPVHLPVVAAPSRPAAVKRAG